MVPVLVFVVLTSTTLIVFLVLYLKPTFFRCHARFLHLLHVDIELRCGNSPAVDVVPAAALLPPVTQKLTTSPTSSQ
jgi:hypothetical protein